MERTTAWAVLGSVAINLMLGFVIAAVFSVTPSAQADEVAQCAAEHAAQPASQPVERKKQDGGYLVAVRMGWAAG